MSQERDLTVGYHQQDTNYYCGAACAQMVLASLGLGLLDQDQLYNDNHSHSTQESGWSTAPDGLHWTLYHYSESLPHPIPTNPNEPVDWCTTLDYHLASSEDAISRKICWTIEHYRIAPISLVFGAQHWIVVRGYAADRAPTSAGDPGFAIDHFHVNNPWPPVPSFYNPTLAPPPPHTASDGCGTGGNRGIADEVINYPDWRNTYMTGVTFGCWNGKFISLCDPNPPATEPGRQKLIIRPFPGTSVIPAASAAQLAINGLKEAGLFTKPGNWQLILNRVEPGQPQLVQRLDHPDEYYYIVPMMSGGHLEAASRVDARFGIHLGSILSPPVLTAGGAAAASPLFLSHEEATARVADQRIELGMAGRVMIRPEGMVAYPTLVWKPCLESLSPYYPFRMFIAGNTHLYVRVDGQTFTQLHDDSRGV